MCDKDVPRNPTFQQLIYWFIALERVLIKRMNGFHKNSDVYCTLTPIPWQRIANLLLISI